jgi:hypothetical protein
MVNFYGETELPEYTTNGIEWNGMMGKWCHDTQHNDTKQNGLICDTQHK